MNNDSVINKGKLKENISACIYVYNLCPHSNVEYVLHMYMSTQRDGNIHNVRIYYASQSVHNKTKIKQLMLRIFLLK